MIRKKLICNTLGIFIILLMFIIYNFHLCSKHFQVKNWKWHLYFHNKNCVLFNILKVVLKLILKIERNIFALDDLTVTRIRLINGSSDYDGRLEVLVNGEWGTVDGNGFGISEASVACRMMNLRWVRILVRIIFRGSSNLESNLYVYF